MKAIIVEYISPSNVRGARLRAYDLDGNSLTLTYDNADGSRDDRMRYAAEALCNEMGWDGKETLIAGEIKDGTVFVFPPRA